MKDGNHDEKTILPCYYVEKLGKECFCISLFEIDIFFQKMIGVSVCNIVVDATLVIYNHQKCYLYNYYNGMS